MYTGTIRSFYFILFENIRLFGSMPAIFNTNHLPFLCIHSCSKTYIFTEEIKCIQLVYRHAPPLILVSGGVFLWVYAECHLVHPTGIAGRLPDLAAYKFHLQTWLNGHSLKKEHTCSERVPWYR